MAKLYARKGASKKVARNRISFEKFTWAKFLLGTSLLVSLLVFYGSCTAVKTVLEVPVEQVDVEGSFRFLTQDEIYRLINNYVVNGFVSVDLKELRAELLELPWVYKASVKRKLPNGLLVTLIEQKPVAFWNEDGMINDAGKLFFPEKLPVIKGLPHLEGKNPAAVLAVYEQLQVHLPAAQGPIQGLSVSESNIVKVVINSNTTLIFNVADLVEKMQMWKNISVAGLDARLAEVDYVDLRYSNGAAVKWRDHPDTQGKKNMGGI